jgi:hypothetical protein
VHAQQHVNSAGVHMPRAALGALLQCGRSGSSQSSSVAQEVVQRQIWERAPRGQHSQVVNASHIEPSQVVLPPA